MAKKLVSMKLPPRDKTSEEKMYPTMCVDDDGGPKYPYGLCLNLDDEQLEQLGIDDMPKIDGVVTITAKARVTGVNENQTQSGTHRSLSLQITDLDVGSLGGSE